MILNGIICQAIAGRKTLTFTYKGANREVEPHLIGYDSDGGLTLSAWQLSGGSGTGFRDFHVSKLSALSTGQHTFEGPRAGYNRWDKTIDRVLCRL